MINLNQTKEEKEKAIELMRSNIPPDMLEYKNFVCFKLEPDEKSHSGYSKKPKNPRTGGNASSTNPMTWGSFDEAARAWLNTSGALHGIGFMFGGSPFFGVDIDDIGDQLSSGDFTGADMVQALHTYTEISPSGTGLHCICAGELPPEGRKNNKTKIEMYSEGRFFTLTGNVYANPRTVCDCTETIKPYHAKYIKPEGKKDKNPPALPSGAAAADLTESTIIYKATIAANGSTFKALFFDGNTSRYNGDDSAADMALCNLLAFWTGKDAGMMDTLFRKSALYRPKWDELRGAQTYGQITIGKAINSCDKCYDMNYNNLQDTKPAHFKPQALTWEGEPEQEQPAEDQSEDSDRTPQELPADPRKWTEEQWQLFAAWHYKTPFDPDNAAPFNRFKYLYVQCWKHRLLKYEKLPEYIQPTCKVKKIGGFEQSVITGFCINPIPLARDLVESLHIINIPSSAQGLLYIYKGGKYVKIDPEQERGIIRGRLEMFDRDGAMWNTKTIRDCSTILHSPLETHSLDDFNADENLINFKNGLLDISTGELKPHDPAVLSTVQLPLDYDPNAGTETPCFDNMIGHLSSGNEEVKKMLLQICALAVSNVNIGRLKMFLLMYGARDSGKSMLFTLLSRLLGEENTHATNLYLLEENRFEAMNACGKRLVGTPELDNNSVVHHVGIIKALTGGDLIRAEIKCGGTYNFRYRGVILFSSNDKPRLPSADAAFYDRLRLVEVPRSIKDKDPYFIEKLYAERQRIINKLLPYLTETMQAGAVIDPETSKKLKFAYKADNAVEIMFFNECCTMRDQLVKITDNQTRTYIYGKFRDWCYENGIKDIPSSRDFTKRLDSYILEEKLNTWGAKLDKRNGRFFTFTYHDPTPAQTFAAEVQNVESVTDLPPW